MCVCACACISLQRQSDIVHIHSCKTILGNMSASLTSVLGSIILLAPLCFSFSFASAGHSTLEDCIQVTGVPVKMESSDREKWSEKSNLSVASSSMSPVTSMQSHCTYLVSVLAHKQPNKYNRCTNAKVSTCDWIEVRCGAEE